MRTLLLAMLLLPFGHISTAQIIDDDYRKIGFIERDPRTHDKIPFYFIADAERNVVLVGYDFTPTLWEAYRLDTWQKLSYFETKGHSSTENSFFHQGNQEVVYIKKSGGKLISEVNYMRGTVVNRKCKDLPQGCYYQREKEYTSFWQEDYSHQYFFYQQYVFEVEDYRITAYERTR